MRKITIGLFAVVVFFCINGFAQNSLPQWKVVKTFSLSKQATPIRPTNLFIPETAGQYRYTAYMSALGATQTASWTLEFIWTDPTGIEGFADLTASLYDGNSFNQVGPYPFTAEPGMPMWFAVERSRPYPVDSTYSFWFTIEELENQP